MVLSCPAEREKLEQRREGEPGRGDGGRCKVFLIVCATKMKLDSSIFRSQI